MGMEVQPLQEMVVMLLVAMAGMLVEEVTEVTHLVVLDEAMKSLPIPVHSSFHHR